MSIKGILASAAAALLLAAAGAPASAASYINITTTGVVTSGTDDLGLFGPAHANLAGKAFTFKLSIDTSCCVDLGPSPPDYYDRLWGIQDYGPTPLGFDIEINGAHNKVTGAAHFEATIFSVAAIYPTKGYPTNADLVLYSYFDHLTSGTYGAFNFSHSSFGVPTTLSPFGPDACTVAPLCYGRYNFGQYTGNNTGIDLSLQSLTYAEGETPFFSVPEPATWAMLIGGFAMMGAALRRRTHAPA